MIRIFTFFSILFAPAILFAQITTPPTSPIRTAAEWEEVQALAIAWDPYNGASTTTMQARIIEAAKEQCKVIVLCSDPTQVTNKLNSLGITNYIETVDILQADYNSIWIRDYGGNSCYLNDVDSLVYVDWVYNRPSRVKDDNAPTFLATQLSMPIYATTASDNKLIHTGGNFMCDGMGNAFSSNLVLEENTISENNIDNIMQSFMGIDNYIKMETLPYDDIHHIDMHIKLLDEGTLLVGEYPEGVADGPQIEANIQYILAQYSTPAGTPYNIVRIPMPPENNQYPNNGGDYRTYTNAVFVNKSILVPTYELQYDSTALRIWEETMPGYNVVGINSNATIPSLGAIHCITKEIATADNLWIAHVPYPNVVEALPNYEIIATIKHKSGINTAFLYYTTNIENPNWQMIAMYAEDGIWKASIPSQPDGTTVYYYIEANANSGKQQVRPIVAPEGYFKFNINIPVTTEGINPVSFKPIFPNPAKAITCVPIYSEKSTNIKLEIVDIYGRLVHVIHNGLVSAGDSKYFFDASALTNGTYSVVLRNQYGLHSQTFIVAK